jgi:hypothetical protein
VARREVTATALTGEGPLSGHDLLLELDVRAALWPDDSVLPLDNALQFCPIEYFACDRRIRGNCLQSVDDVG